VTWVRLGGICIIADNLVTLTSTYQNLLKFVEILRSSGRNKNAQFFFRHGVESFCFESLMTQQSL